MLLFMKDSKTDIKGNLIYRDSKSETRTRFESTVDLKKIILELHSGRHSGDIELDGCSVIVFNGIKKSSLVDFIESLEKGEMYETYYSKEIT